MIAIKHFPQCIKIIRYGLFQHKYNFSFRSFVEGLLTKSLSNLLRFETTFLDELH